MEGAAVKQKLAALHLVLRTRALPVRFNKSKVGFETEVRGSTLLGVDTENYRTN